MAKPALPPSLNVAQEQQYQQHHIHDGDPMLGLKVKALGAMLWNSRNETTQALHRLGTRFAQPPARPPASQLTNWTSGPLGLLVQHCLHTKSPVGARATTKREDEGERVQKSLNYGRCLPVSLVGTGLPSTYLP
ncbi:hypothetical protein OIDMADRAFT_32011 [Oidiodendron maius Zn]|uniref:Uncharacterized protein n=1 Tax=Oidiodendron maius (strain Zn) TaxID=913774 RepID=A0A0C3CGM8_OIDMZ|nr:hypothetical protein OIDMADRAFT_32011 [Oidiodendron maius Zn]